MRIPDLLWVLLYFEDGVWNAHALDLDLVGSGATASEAWEELKDAIFTQLAFAIQNAVVDVIERPAPKNYWARLKDAERLSESDLVKGLDAKREYSMFVRLDDKEIHRAVTETTFDDHA